jgi:peptidoglycan/LPS O-acetylase OafA/YrhL
MYYAWLLTLPYAGALAAFLARRAGARTKERLAAALFPALALAIETAYFGIATGFFWRIPIYWVLVPAVVCALGAVPFLRGNDRERSKTIETKREAAIG